MEIFNSNAVSDIQERMANFNELNFYDGTLNTNLSLEEAHAKVELMRDEVMMMITTRVTSHLISTI